MAAVRFVESLRSRGIEAQAFEALLEPLAEPILSQFETLTAYVLGVSVGPSPEHQIDPLLANLHQQFRQQAAMVGGRI